MILLKWWSCFYVKYRRSIKLPMNRSPPSLHGLVLIDPVNHKQNDVQVTSPVEYCSIASRLHRFSQFVPMSELVWVCFMTQACRMQANASPEHKSVSKPFCSELRTCAHLTHCHVRHAQADICYSIRLLCRAATAFRCGRTASKGCPGRPLAHE